MLKIRLSRQGKRNKPVYRLIISESAKDPYGRALEILGFYNPHTKDLQVKDDRIKHWLGNGAQMTPTVNNLLVDKKIIEGKKVKASKKGKKENAEEDNKKPAEVKKEVKTEEPIKEEKKEEERPTE